jgi:hypothetical protein
LVLIPHDGKPIYAHENVLAAGCDNLRDAYAVCVNENGSAKQRELLQLVRCHASSISLACVLMLVQNNVIAFGGRKLSQDSFESAIKHMYCFEFKGVGHSLLDLAEVAVVAEELEIIGLYELVSKIANRAMSECVNNEAKMKDFLSIGRHYGQGVITGKRIFYPLAVEVLGKNFIKIYDRQVVQDTFALVPTLMSDLLQFLGDRRRWGGHESEEDEEDSQ